MKLLHFLFIILFASTLYAQPTYIHEKDDIDSTSIQIQSIYEDIDTIGFSDSIFTFVEIKPSFHGGYFEMKDYISKAINYPAIALENNISGNCVAEFVVLEDGSITNVKILRDIGGGCGAEAKRIVEAMPKWNPGIHHGIRVKTKVTIPIKFDIINSDPSFPGGIGALQQFINSLLITPQDIQKKQIKGKVGITIYISSEGEITSTKVEYNTLEMPSAEVEALRVISLMPQWIPAIQNNKQVASSTVLIFSF